MQLRALAGLGLALALSATGAPGQSLSPMRAQGPTPSLVKGFQVKVGNPYRVRMTFVLTVMDAQFANAAPDAVVQPARLTLAPGYARPVLVAFKIAPSSKERTIGLCITPDKIAGPIRPRVCGTYTGLLLKGAGG